MGGKLPLRFAQPNPAIGLKMKEKSRSIDPIVGLCVLFGVLMYPINVLGLLFQEDVQEPAPALVSKPFVVPYNHVVQPVQDAVVAIIPPVLPTPLLIIVLWTGIALAVTYPLRLTFRRLFKRRP